MPPRAIPLILWQNSSKGSFMYTQAQEFAHLTSLWSASWHPLVSTLSHLSHHDVRDHVRGIFYSVLNTHTDCLAGYDNHASWGINVAAPSVKLSGSWSFYPQLLPEVRTGCFVSTGKPTIGDPSMRDQPPMGDHLFGGVVQFNTVKYTSYARPPL